MISTVISAPLSLSTDTYTDLAERLLLNGQAMTIPSRDIASKNQEKPQDLWLALTALGTL